jgi:hypothetical protein
MKPLTAPMLKALCRAAKRERGNVCPIQGVHPNAEMMLLHALRKRGLIDGMNEDGMGVPYINEAGRAIIVDDDETDEFEAGNATWAAAVVLAP